MILTVGKQYRLFASFNWKNINPKQLRFSSHWFSDSFGGIELDQRIMQQMHFLHRIRRKILGQTLRSIMLSEYSSPKLMSFVLILIALFAESASIVSASGEQSAVNSLINLQKRVDYRTCIGETKLSRTLYIRQRPLHKSSLPDRFEVHRDTIIQTDDSRAMGANFLYHVEAANRDECLRDCCETDRCDVFVFEEKARNILNADQLIMIIN